MRMHGKLWNIVVVMASVATGLLIAPPVANAEMIASRTQSKISVEHVRQELRSEIMRQQIQRFGLSKSEARQIQAALSDEQVLREIAQFETQLAYASRAMIKQSTTYRLIGALESAIEKHMGNEIQGTLSERAREAFGNERLIASHLSVNSDTISVRQAHSKLQRSLTTEKLVALGMTKEDAVRTVAKLKDSDFGTIIKDDIQLGHAAGLKLTDAGMTILIYALVIGGLLLLTGGESYGVWYVLGIIALILFVGWLMR